MKEVRLTEERLRDKRFRDTETKIILALSSAKDTISPSRLVKTVHISRSTFYRHHRTVYDIVPDYERYLFDRYRRSIARMASVKNVRLTHLYERTLIFLLKHREIVIFLLEYSEGTFIEKMLYVLEPKIMATNKIRGSFMLGIYIKEVAEVIRQWIKEDFGKADVPLVLDKIVYLTNTASIRLGPVTQD